MSGGHYMNGNGHYLCFTDAEDILNSGTGIKEMADDLAALGYAEDAARETEELLVLIRQFHVRAQVRLKRLQPIWKAMDWWAASDSGEEEVKAALVKYRGDDSSSGEIITEKLDEPKSRLDKTKYNFHNTVTNALVWHAKRLGYAQPIHDTQALIDWAAGFTDSELLTWRNIGPKSIAWIRAEVIGSD